MPTCASARARRARFPRVAMVTLAALFAACTSHPRTTPVPSAAAQRSAADTFVAAWRRSLEGTWAVESVFERRIGTRRLTDDVREAQRPPDRLRVAGGTVEGRVNGHTLACNTGADGQLACRDGGPAPPFEDDVRRQLDTLAGYFAGPVPLYRAEVRGGDCYGLVLLRSILAPPYGETARFCFDHATGAPAVGGDPQARIGRRDSCCRSAGRADSRRPDAADRELDDHGAGGDDNQHDARTDVAATDYRVIGDR